MNNRERTVNLLHYKPVDRLPAVHFGYWPELLEEWAAQGKIPAELAHDNHDGSDKDHELDKIIGWDFNYSHVIGSNDHLDPVFEEKVIEVLPDGSIRQQTRDGVIERVKPGVSSIPAEDDYLLKDREAFEKYYRPRMQFYPERVEAGFTRFNDNRPQDIPFGILLGSVIGNIRNMTTVTGLSYLMYDEDEDLLADIIDTYANLQYRCTEEILKTGAKFDFAHYWEDICFKNGPLISPVKFEELCAKHYKKRNDLCRSYGIDIISVDCDGVIGQLIPIWLETGVNIMFPLEVGVWGDQFEPARKKYGERLLGVGGMDKTALRKDKAAVDSELSRMERLASLGGFIPCPDHRLMPGTKFELVQYYAEKIKEIRL